MNNMIIYSYVRLIINLLKKYELSTRIRVIYLYKKLIYIIIHTYNN